MNEIYYIENCISRILQSSCHPSNFKQMCEDIADIVSGAEISLKEAHRRALCYSNKAQKGGYKSAIVNRKS